MTPTLYLTTGERHTLLDSLNDQAEAIEDRLDMGMVPEGFLSIEQERLAAFEGLWEALRTDDSALPTGEALDLLREALSYSVENCTDLALIDEATEYQDLLDKINSL